MIVSARITLIAAVTLPAVVARADLAEYYVGIDGRATIPTGVHIGKPNPNFNRLAMLYQHADTASPAGSHYHNKSAYSYVGEATSTAFNPFPANNFLPEGTTTAPIPLVAGSGAFDGLLRSGLTAPTESYPWSDLEIRATDSLRSETTGSPGAFLYTSSVGGYVSATDGASLNLRVVSLTAGLKLYNIDGSEAADGAGDVIPMGVAGEAFSFTPIFAAAVPGNHSARFVLVDSNTAAGRTPFGDSGEFVFKFTAVPEPASLSLIGLGAMALLRRKRA